MRTSLNHQSEAQNPKCSVIHKLLADYPIFSSPSRNAAIFACASESLSG